MNRLLLWLSRHWLALFNLFFFIYVGLPVLAPALLAFGYSDVALTIYRAYGLTCHQLPDHSYFILGYQVAICQRCTAIHATMALAGLLYILLRHRRLPPLSFRWYPLFLIPIGMDGGMQLISDLLRVVPVYSLWLVGLAAIVLFSLFLYFQNRLVWQVWLFFIAGPVSLLLVQQFGFYESDGVRRTLTGIIYAVGTIWLVYPTLEESFREIGQVTISHLMMTKSD